MKVLMIGAGRDVKGGVSTVVNQYYEAGLDNLVDLTYIPTMEDGSKIKKLLVAAKAYSSFCKVINDIDIVHIHMSHRASFYRKSRFIEKAASAGKKIIIHMHGSEFDVFYEKECNDKQKAYVKRIFSMVDIVIALSEEWKNKLSVICNPGKIIVLHNAVILPDFERTDYSDKNILFLGRLGKRKGAYDLLEAIPGVLDVVPDAHLFLGGDGDMEEIKRIIEEKSLSGSVFYIGWVTGEKKDKMLRKCSVFTLPSYHEGMPMAILEAMSYGQIVVSTNVGGIPKVIDNDINGFLVTPGDIENLSQKLIIALTNPNKNYIGSGARKTVFDKFNMKKNIRILTDIYSKLLDGYQGDIV